MRENKPRVFNLLKIRSFRSSFKFVSMRSWHQPMRGNIKLMAKRSMKIRGKGHLVMKMNGLNRLNEVQKIHQEKQSEVRHFCVIRIFCLRFLWGWLSVGFATRLLLFMTVSWRLLFLNVLGNVKFTSFVRYNAQFKLTNRISRL